MKYKYTRKQWFKKHGDETDYEEKDDLLAIKSTLKKECKHLWFPFSYIEPIRIDQATHTAGCLFLFCQYCLKTKLIHPEKNVLK